MTVAALYVDPHGVYVGLPGVEVWDEARDARTYAGPWPVVAHPPCARWSLMGMCRGYYDGQDGGCFEAALGAVRTFGGVLEHPAHSLAWRTFGLPRTAGAGWTHSLLDDGWACEVDQRRYGHEARKPTWLYYVGPEPPPMRWGRGTSGERTVGRGWGGGREHKRAATPSAFRDVLLAMARSADKHEHELTHRRECGNRREPQVPDLPPTRFCGACGHPSVSAHGGGWKCRDCGAVLPHYVVFGGRRASDARPS